MTTPIQIRKTRGLYETFPRKGGPAPTATHYCAGCGHGIIHKLIGEALADLGLQDRTIMISPVGCAVFAYYYFDCGNVQVAHGRAPAVGTGLARSCPEAVIISYQGDGDLGSIGFNQTFQAANRGERIVIFFINNAVYGMTGGQMAPTTLIGQKTVTSPDGRDSLTSGFPLHACEVVNTLQAPVYIERCSVSDIKHIHQARRAIRHALEIQRDRKGFAFVEFLSPCPTNMHQTQEEATRFINEEMEKEFPLGRLRDRAAEVAPQPVVAPVATETLAALFDEGMTAKEPPQPDPACPEIRIKIAGHGGQGVLSAGLILAGAGLQARRFVSWYPSYGPEQRGGTSNCSVVISGMPIGSPAVSRLNVLVAMNQPALDRFSGDVVPGGLILYDSSLAQPPTVPGVTCRGLPAMQIAGDAGASKAANTAMLGALSASGMSALTPEAFDSALEHAFSSKPKLVILNRAIFNAAATWFRDNPS